MRKQTKFRDGVEYYGFHRAQRSIRRADVVLLFLDAAEAVGTVDKHLADYVVSEFKPVVLIVNKWDLAAGKATQEDYRDYLDKTLPYLTYAPICFVSAKDTLNVKATIRLAEQLYRQAATRMPTAQLNRAMEEVIAQRGPSHKHGTLPPKVLYATQIAACPPTIVCFVNGLESFNQPYQRFFLAQLRQRLPFQEVPVRLIFRARRQTKDRQVAGE